MRLLVVSSVLGLGLLLAACGGQNDGPRTSKDGDSPDDTSVVVNLKNWAVEPSTTTMASGKVKFTAMHAMDHHDGMMANEGGATHELIVAAEEPPGSGNFGKILLRITDLKPGDSSTKSIDLPPGTYELSCQIGELVNGKAVSHYEKGMRTTITVT